MRTVRLDLPPAFRDLADPPRILTYHGGRGAAKSWSIVAWLVARAWSAPERIVIAREVLKSIRASSHQLCIDTIERLGLTDAFEVQRDEIRCHRTGSTIRQVGFRDSGDSFRSAEGVSILFVDEAQSVTTASLDAVLPTVRREGSVIVFAMNPQAPTDPVYVRYVLDPPANARAVRVNYTENPYFPAVLREQLEHMRATDPDRFRHVWLGEPVRHTAASVFAGKYRIEPFEVTDALGPPAFGCDFGFARDPSVAVRCHVVEDGRARTLYVSHEAHGVGVELDELAALFMQVPGIDTHVSRADSSRPETIAFLQRRGLPRMEAVEKWPGSVLEGVEYLRGFSSIVVHPRCELTIEEMALYRYKVDARTGDVLPELVDAANHCVDSIRYALEPLIRRRPAPAPAAAAVPAAFW